jgi:hypothetical protein
MSVYIDHIYIKPTKTAYQELFSTFKNMIGEDLFQFGEFEADGEKWGGFFVYFENGSFLEILDPEVSKASQAVGLCMTCEKEYRGHFLDQIGDVLQGKDVEFRSIPEEDTAFKICRLKPSSYLTSWGVEYSDTWYKEWGSRGSKLGLLSPFESFENLQFIYPQDQTNHIQDNLSWIDPRLLEQNLALPLKGGKATDISFVEGEKPQAKISFSVEEEVKDFEITGEGFSFVVRDGIAAINTDLTA